MSKPRAWQSQISIQFLSCQTVDEYVVQLRWIKNLKQRSSNDGEMLYFLLTIMITGCEFKRSGNANEKAKILTFCFNCMNKE